MVDFHLNQNSKNIQNNFGLQNGQNFKIFVQNLAILIKDPTTT